MPPVRVDEQDLQGRLQESLARHRVPGASLAVLHEGQVTAVSAGVTNLTTGVALTPQTVMHIGSITKVFNATLILQLVDEGLIDLDERVLRYLPDLQLKDREALEQITVKMLLNHTSGIDGIMLPDYGHDEETIEKGVQRFAQLGQLFAPGAEFSYCNAATVIAGYLAQRLRGMSWHRLVRERIFEPLEMKHAATLPEEALLHRASVGHFPGTEADARFKRVSFAFLPLSLAPAGTTLMMSAQDLIVFAQAHMQRGLGPNGVRILSASGAETMQRVTVDNQGKGYTCFDMGIGWMTSREGLITHAGGAPGVLTTLYAHPESGFAAALLTNGSFSYGLINDFMEPWLEAVCGARPLGLTSIRVSSQSVAIDPERYVGVYEDIGHRYRVLKSEEGIMLSQQARFAPYEYISTEETPPARLIALGEDTFMLESPGQGAADRASAFFRQFTFRGADAAGRMRFLGNSLRLFPRVA